MSPSGNTPSPFLLVGFTVFDSVSAAISLSGVRGKLYARCEFGVGPLAVTVLARKLSPVSTSRSQPCPLCYAIRCTLARGIVLAGGSLEKCKALIRKGVLPALRLVTALRGPWSGYGRCLRLDPDLRRDPLLLHQLLYRHPHSGPPLPVHGRPPCLRCAPGTQRLQALLW